jgi:hypothetical protein
LQTYIPSGLPTAKAADRRLSTPYDALKCLAREARIVTLAAAQVSTGHPLTTADADRVRLAHERLRDAALLMGVRL